MTGKQKVFSDAILNNPTITGIEAVQKAGYKVKNRHTAEVIASENLRKPEIMAYLSNHVDKAQTVVVEAMGATRKQYGFNPDTKSMELVGEDDDHAIRLRAADSLLDRIYGKAKQSVEIQSTTVSISIDLSGTDTEQG